MAIRVFHRDEAQASLPIISKDARLIVWPGVGAQYANMNYVHMEPGEENVPHVHAESEDTIFMLAGHGTLRDLTNATTMEVRARQAIHVPPGIQHALLANRGTSIESIGGPCPPDRKMLAAFGDIGLNDA